MNKLIVFLSISIAIYPPISFCPHNHNTLSMYSLKWRQEVKSLSLMIINPFSSVLFKAPLFLSGAAREEQTQPFLSIRAPPREPVDWRRRPLFTHTPISSAHLVRSSAHGCSPSRRCSSLPYNTHNPS